MEENERKRERKQEDKEWMMPQSGFEVDAYFSRLSQFETEGLLFTFPSS